MIKPMEPLSFTRVAFRPVINTLEMTARCKEPFTPSQTPHRRGEPSFAPNTGREGDENDVRAGGFVYPSRTKDSRERTVFGPTCSSSHLYGVFLFLGLILSRPSILDRLSEIWNGVGYV